MEAVFDYNVILNQAVQKIRDIRAPRSVSTLYRGARMQIIEEETIGMQFKELLSTLWMKTGAIGKCPVVDAGVPDMLILPDNKMAILNDENRFAEFAEQLAQHPEIHVVYLVTDYESSFISMTRVLDGKQTYQLYRDYLDNFRINAGRNSR